MKSSTSNGIGAAQMNGLHTSFDSISKSNMNNSVDEDPSFTVYETTRPDSNFGANFDAR